LQKKRPIDRTVSTDVSTDELEEPATKRRKYDESGTCIYVLLLAEGKYYVGKTDNLSRRLQDHFNGKGAVWTSLYTPIDCIDVRPMKSPFDELAVTKEYMLKKGIENVRGGSYVRVQLDPSEIYVLRREMFAATNCCLKCGSQTIHFSEACSPGVSSKYDKGGRDSIPTCTRCGRLYHSAENCYASATLDGVQLLYNSNRRQNFRKDRQARLNESQYLPNNGATLANQGNSCTIL
jgi:predicted GIY-YIG superfamily endonuclease